MRNNDQSIGAPEIGDFFASDYERKIVELTEKTAAVGSATSLRAVSNDCDEKVVDPYSTSSVAGGEGEGEGNSAKAVAGLRAEVSELSERLASQKAIHDEENSKALDEVNDLTLQNKRKEDVINNLIAEVSKDIEDGRKPPLMRGFPFALFLTLTPFPPPSGGPVEAQGQGA